MILEAIVLVKRKDGYFYLDRRGVYKVYEKDFALKRMRVFQDAWQGMERGPEALRLRGVRNGER